MRDALLREAVRFGDERHDVADLVLVGVVTTDWQALVTEVRRGVALERTRDGRPTREELSNELTAFRYAHRLIAAADLMAWLADRSLQLQDLEGVLQRRWLRDRFHDASVQPVSDAQLASCMWAEALVAGTLQRCTETLIAWHAGTDWVAAIETAHSGTWSPVVGADRTERIAAVVLDDSASGLRALGVADVARRVQRVIALQAGYERFRSQAVTEKAVDARLARHRMDWTVVDGTELSFEREGAARETRMHVVADGETLPEVASLLGVETVSRQLEIGTAPAEISATLLAAQQGDLLGPWKEDGRWRVLEVAGKTEPESAADEALRSRARDELLGEMVERLVSGRVVTHGTL
jgi:hypothetical protein